MQVYPGNVAPDREGVYVVTTDEPGCWGYFMGYFNGQYWYEYTRADHFENPKRVPRKRTARLAVTAWAAVDSHAFSKALHQKGKAPLDLAGRAFITEQREFDRQSREQA